MAAKVAAILDFSKNLNLSEIANIFARDVKIKQLNILLLLVKFS